MTANLNSDPFDSWLADLERRHLADLRFAEVSRALRALSSTYVEKRGKLGEGAALSGAGKRAAFALFYGPLHFLVVREIVNALKANTPGREATLVDLGCGTGAAGAAWASACEPAPAVVGIDTHSWAVDEAARTYRQFTLKARTNRGDIARWSPPRSRAWWLAAFTLNELPDQARDALLERLIERGRAGDRVLIVEPIAKGVAPWWNGWVGRFAAVGGRADEWRFRVLLPPLVQKLDRAASLDHRELTARSLWIG